MYFISIISHVAIFNKRYKTTLYLPHLKFEHAKVFKTVFMNNVIDYATLVIPDIVTVGILFPLYCVVVVPQLIFKGGYFVATSIYYLGSDIDEFLTTKNYKMEPIEPEPPVEPTEPVKQNPKKSEPPIKPFEPYDPRKY
jgi:hypothetical protein